MIRIKINVIDKICQFCNKHWDDCKQIYQWILCILLFIIVWFNYERFWLELFNRYVLPLLNFEESRVLLFIVMFIVIILLWVAVIYHFIKSIKNRFLWDSRIVISSMLISMIYWKYRIEGEYTYEYILQSIAFSDMLILILAEPLVGNIICRILLIKDKHILEKGLILTNAPIENNKEDILQFNINAKQIADVIFKSNVEKSLSIGIIGLWGSGKTSMMNLVKENLGNGAIIVNYNPRNSQNVRNIQEDFFNVLKTNLNKFHSNIDFLINEYMYALQLFGKDAIFYRIVNFISKQGKDKSKRNLNSIIKRLPKKLVIFIDDFDRLYPDEILEIFKLIDNNASFSNTVFVTAFDKDSVNNVIKKSIGLETENFSDKFFDVEFYIPIRSYENMFSYLSDKLMIMLEANESEQIEYQSVLDSNKSIIKMYLHTLREVKQFLNLLYNDFMPVKGELVFKDYFLLTLIKFSNNALYDNLYKKKYLITSNSKSYVYEKDLHSKLDNKYIQILDILFPNFGPTNGVETHIYGHINDYLFFEYYFINYFLGKLPHEIVDIANQDILSFRTGILNINKEEVYNVLRYLKTRNIYNFNNKEELVGYIEKIFYCSIYYHDELFEEVCRLLYDNVVSSLCDHYNIAKDDYKKLIFDNLRYKTSDNRFNSNVIRRVIINKLNGVNYDSIILSHEELLDISKKNLQEHISDINGEFDWEIMNLLYSCISKIDQVTNKISLDKDSCKMVKDLIFKSPNIYLKQFVRLGSFSSNPEINSIVCEPFWDQIFDSVEDFDRLMQTCDNKHIEKFVRVERFWELYKNNDLKPIKFENQGDVQKIIDNDLEIPYGWFKELKELENKFTEYSKSQTSKERYIKILESAKMNRLNIMFRDRLIEKINNKIQEL